ncbi:21934_t:CDS:2 [Gigaspora margarita]|uniref:21934_t:CDS:1 n=1 Tax=Gigaspora margarita TaxID=4874 RepID=A0ABM8VZ57_GIGMA|nr:21934_t:CDS:2 [Gigaspora margarita]
MKVDNNKGTEEFVHPPSYSGTSEKVPITKPQQKQPTVTEALDTNYILDKPPGRSVRPWDIERKLNKLEEVKLEKKIVDDELPDESGCDMLVEAMMRGTKEILLMELWMKLIEECPCDKIEVKLDENKASSYYCLPTESDKLDGVGNCYHNGRYPEKQPDLESCFQNGCKVGTKEETPDLIPCEGPIRNDHVIEIERRTD